MTSCIEVEEAMVFDSAKNFGMLLVELVESMIWVQLGVDVLVRFLSWSHRELRSGTSVVGLLLTGSRLPYLLTQPHPFNVSY